VLQLLDVVSPHDFAHGYYLTDREVAARLRTVYLQGEAPKGTPSCRNAAPEDDCPR
jgi:hypothetical protein